MHVQFDIWIEMSSSSSMHSPIEMSIRRATSHSHDFAQLLANIFVCKSCITSDTWAWPAIQFFQTENQPVL
ncbi:hypothetical protein M5D96_012798, partial [Drosophila gunungcola]